MAASVDLQMVPAESASSTGLAMHWELRVEDLRALIDENLWLVLWKPPHRLTTPSRPNH